MLDEKHTGRSPRPPSTALLVTAPAALATDEDKIMNDETFHLKRPHDLVDFEERPLSSLSKAVRTSQSLQEPMNQAATPLLMEEGHVPTPPLLMEGQPEVWAAQRSQDDDDDDASFGSYIEKEDDDDDSFNTSIKKFLE